MQESSASFEIRLDGLPPEHIDVSPDGTALVKEYDEF